MRHKIEAVVIMGVLLAVVLFSMKVLAQFETTRNNVYEMIRPQNHVIVRK